MRAHVKPYRPRSDPLAAAIALPVVERLTRTVTAETEDIAAGRPARYELYGQRKNQSLLELNRLMPALARAGGGERLRAALAELNAALEANKRALGVQLKASIAVAEIIARAIRDGQSDGTYTARTWRGHEE
jgi:hypothetical protein